MSEEENLQSVQELAPPSDTETKQDDPVETAQTSLESPTGDQGYNWAEARRKMHELERRTEEQERIIRQLQEDREEPEEDDDLEKLADDDIVTAKQARSLATRMAREVAQEAIREQAALTAEDRLKSKYPDFDDVVTKEQIDLLKRQEPELAQSLFALASDPYAQAVAAYKLLKKTGVAPSQANKARAVENSKKPVSVQTVTKSSAIGNVHKFENGLTQQVKDQLWAEMQEAIKGY